MNAHVTLSPEQLARLEAAIIRRPSRTYIDRDGNTRWTQVSINQFISQLVKFHRAHGYLTDKQLACVSHIVQADKPA